VISIGSPCLRHCVHGASISSSCQPEKARERERRRERKRERVSVTYIGALCDAVRDGWMGCTGAGWLRESDARGVPAARRGRVVTGGAILSTGCGVAAAFVPPPRTSFTSSPPTVSCVVRDLGNYDPVVRQGSRAQGLSARKSCSSG
jgi:hypothetical protein